MVQDILAGFFIITERQYGFGDTVQIAITGSGTDAEGVIEDVTLRVTRMRNADGEVITVPNGQIVKAVNLSKDWARAVVDVPIPASADINRVNDILHRVGVDAYEDKSLRPLLLDTPSVMGVESRGRPGQCPDGGPHPAGQAVPGGSGAARSGRHGPAPGGNHRRGGTRSRSRGAEVTTNEPPGEDVAAVEADPARRVFGGRMRTTTVVLCLLWLGLAMLNADLNPPADTATSNPAPAVSDGAPAAPAPQRETERASTSPDVHPNLGDGGPGDVVVHLVGDESEWATVRHPDHDTEPGPQHALVGVGDEVDHHAAPGPAAVAGTGVGNIRRGDDHRPDTAGLSAVVDRRASLPKVTVR